MASHAGEKCKARENAFKSGHSSWNNYLSRATGGRNPSLSPGFCLLFGYVNSFLSFRHTRKITNNSTELRWVWEWQPGRHLVNVLRLRITPVRIPLSPDPVIPALRTFCHELPGSDTCRGRKIFFSKVFLWHCYPFKLTKKSFYILCI